LLERSKQIAAALGGAAALGALGACAIWLASGEGLGPLGKIAVEEARLIDLPLRTGRSATSALSNQALQAAAVLFAQPPAMQVRLDGVARTPGRVAALVAIGDTPARWVPLGSTVDGVTLIGVGSARATIDNGEGPQQIDLGQTIGPQQGGAPATTAADLSDQAPAGRGLEPASAPGM
jgi:hypothetical protein